MEKEKITVKQDKNMKISELLKEQIQKSKYPVVAVKLNNEYKSLDSYIEESGEIQLVDITEKEGMKIYRRTLTFIMGKAFESLYPEAHVIVDYQLSNAMYCTIENMEITNEMIEKVKQKMQDIINQDLKIERKTMNREEAEEFYQKTNTPKGRLQFDFKENKYIHMYYCEDYYNYIYEIIATHTGIISIFDAKKYSKGFVIRYPSTSQPDILPEFKETKKLLWALEEYETIYRILNVGTVYRLNKAVKENRIKDLILLSEALHEKKISQIADKISNKKGVKMVLIAGPSSSGKTTFAQRLGIQLKLNGLKPVTISVDNYFVEREDTPRNENGDYDFECIEAIDTELFNKHLVALLNGEEVEMPEFNFHKGTKEYKGKKIKLEKDEILVIEGIHCLNDKLTEKISQDQKYKIYISALTVLNMDSFNRISTTDTRLIRRIVRDNQFRGYTAKDTISTWNNVNKGEEKYIFPFQEEADSIFNTSLIYELGALKNEAMPLLEQIKNDEREYAEARRLIKKLRYFEPIPKELVPSNSLLKEFLGGGDF
ncbi:MAG: nucleoside kinase [Clostridia bacterium]|nr:nucleoside kinase [Clostridia bacterium]